MKVSARVKATLLSKLGQMIEDSGGACDDATLSDWLDTWFTEPLPELNGATPAQLMATEHGQQRVQVLLARMRDGLPA